MLSPRTAQLPKITLAASVALHAFWILLFAKEASKDFAKLMTVHAGVGPLSGLYLYSTLVGILIFLLLQPWRPRNTDQALRTAMTIFFLSLFLWLVLVFPPVYRPLVG